MPSFTGRAFVHLGYPIPERLAVGAVRTGFYLCQLPDFASWAERADATEDEIEDLGSGHLRLQQDLVVPADNHTAYEAHLEWKRREAARERAAQAPKPAPRMADLIYIPIERLGRSGSGSGEG